MTVISKYFQHNRLPCFQQIQFFHILWSVYEDLLHRRRLQADFLHYCFFSFQTLQETLEFQLRIQVDQFRIIRLFPFQFLEVQI